MTLIKKCWKLPHQSKPWCVNACLQCEKPSGLYLQDTQVRKRRDPKHVNFTVITGTQGGQITHFQLSPGDLHCRLKMPEIKLIIIFLKTRPSSCPFSNCEWCPTESNTCPTLLSSKYHQATQAYQVYLHNLYFIFSLIFCPTVTTRVQIRFSESRHCWRFGTGDSLL